MSVAIVGTIAQLRRIIGCMSDDDILIFREWRITIASDDDRPYWLEGRGHVFKIDRGRNAGGRIRRHIEDVDAAAAPGSGQGVPS